MNHKITLLWTCCYISQIQDGARLPTTYAFALVESCQHTRIVLRLYLAGEFTNGKTDIVEPSPRLSSIRSLITSVKEAERLFYSLKVIIACKLNSNILCFDKQSCLSLFRRVFCYKILYEIELMSMDTLWIYESRIELLMLYLVGLCYLENQPCWLL